MTEMKKKITQILCSCLAVVMLAVLAACSENTLVVSSGGGGGGDVASDKGVAKGYFKLEGQPFNNVSTIHSVVASAQLTENRFEVSALYNAAPQVLVGTNSQGNWTFMYKGVVENGRDIEINEYTTTAALFALCPVFWNVDANNFDAIEKRLRTVDGYDQLVNEVRKLLKENKPVIDEQNTELNKALTTCYANFFNISVKGEMARAYPASSALSVSNRSMMDDNAVRDDFPIEFCPEAQTVAVRIGGWAPPYECTTTNENGEVVETQMVLPHSYYGLMDIIDYIGLVLGHYQSGDKGWDGFSNAWGDLSHGDWRTFKLMNEGDYHFTLDRSTKNAIMAKWVLLANDAFNALGSLTFMVDNIKTITLAPGVTIEPNKNVMSVLISTVLDRLAAYTDPTDLDTYNGWQRCQQLVLDVILNVMREIPDIANEKLLDKDVYEEWVKNAKSMSKILATLEIGGNAVGRMTMWTICPDRIEECFSQHNYVVSNCMGLGVCVKSGNNQTGEAGKPLAEPVRFSVLCNRGQRVRFEVVKGGGTLKKDRFVPLQYDGTTQYFDQEWTLGNAEGEQIFKAWIEDVATGERRTPDCFVTAYISKGSLLTSIGSAYRFTYDAAGRMTSVTDRTCMLVEPDPSEIVTSRFEYRNDTGKELSRIVSTGDGETIVWYDINYNNDGNIKSFKWSGTDEYGTEYGAGRLIYEPDGRINRIISYSDDGQTYLTFTWKGGLLKSISYDDPTATGEDVASETYSITYGDLKNVHETYPSALVMLELGPMFFSGQAGQGTSYLPNRIVGPDMNVSLDYSLRNDGYIVRENMKFGGDYRYAYNFIYSYQDAPGVKSTPMMSSPMRPGALKGLKKRMIGRMFGLRR